MMTSVTLPSSSGPMHGGFSTSVTNEPSVSEHDFETPRPMKRCLVTSLTDSCKKRRKQAMPVRISAADSPPEGKPPVPSPELELHCPMCQLVFNNPDLLQSHLSSEHMGFECKKEPEDIPSQSLDSSELTNATDIAPKNDLPWIPELPNKDWMNPNMLSFSPANHMFMGLPPFSQPDSIPPRQPIRIFNPDAYCELCNKEFCNKYFLKTHKANKHGIYSDPPASEQNTMGPAVNIPSYVSNIKIPTSSVPSVEIKMEPKPQNNAPNYPEIFPNPFANKMFGRIKPLSLFESENPDNNAVNQTNGVNETERNSEESINEEIPSPRNSQQEFAALKHEIGLDQELFYTSPSKLSPGQQSRDLDLTNRLRRIGVMNPKAFCEICCKEYCNKYFLRTHKMKRHGIYIPDDREKDMKLEVGGIPYMQTSPLNLIMGEQSNSSDRKTVSPSDISCDLCGIKFQNLSLLQLHNVSVHSKLPTNNIGNEVVEDKKSVENNQEKILSADSISEDLQKLQTMILQLNDLDVSKNNSTCGTCNKEFENRYYMHAHMMTEHGLLLDDNADAEKSNDVDATINNNTMCDLCGKDFQNFEDLKKHIFEAHRNTQTTPDVKDEFNNGFQTPEKGAVRTPVPSGPISERRASMNLTPTSSYCEICNKELCNKYFMKTHMQRMHGIEIENGAQIGGVICDICNKELCSKYFLRVHKHNTHGIVEYGSSLLQPRKFEENSAPSIPNEADPALKPADLADLSHRYFTHFTEVCTICSRRFRSTKWLKAHLLSDHGQAGAEKWAELEQQLQHTMGPQNKSSTTIISAPQINKPQNERLSPNLKIPTSGAESANQRVGIHNVLSSIFGTDDLPAKTYHCSYCPFTTPVLPFLFVHERSHSMQVTNGDSIQLKCPVCLQTFLQPELLQQHVFTQHPLLPLPPFFNGNNENQNEATSEGAEELEETSTDGSKSVKNKKGSTPKRKPTRPDLPPELDQTLKDIVKKTQMPATYALPQNSGSGSCNSANAGAGEESPTSSNSLGYVMQAFLVEESVMQSNTAAINAEHKFMPSIVFLPVLQKLSAPITATFTLTPA